MNGSHKRNHMNTSIGAEKSFMKIQHRLLKGTFSKTRNRWYKWTFVRVFEWEGTPHLNPSLCLGNSLLSEFWWEGERHRTIEMEKTDAHYSGHGSHSCSSSEALGLSSDGGTKKTGSRKFFFSNFGFNEYREFFMVVLVIAATSVCKVNSDKSTRRCVQAPGASSAGVSSCGISCSKMAVAVPLFSVS